MWALWCALFNHFGHILKDLRYINIVCDISCSSVDLTGAVKSLHDFDSFHIFVPELNYIIQFFVKTRKFCLRSLAICILGSV